MSFIPADQLPSPSTSGSSLAWSPAPALPLEPGPQVGPTWTTPSAAGPAHRRAGGRSPRSIAVLVASGLAVLGLGGFAAHSIGGNDRGDRTGGTHGSAATDATDTPDGTDPTDTSDGAVTPVDAGGAAGDAALTPGEIGAAYTAVFGVAGSAATLDCVASQIGAEGTQTVRLANGETLSLAEAQAAFTPFVACAPDSDFLALMVPVTAQLFNGQVDTTCVSNIFLTFGIEGRAEARALAYADVNQFFDRLQQTFEQCAY